MQVYEAPVCTVCMDPLLCDISATHCGHVFHKNW